MRYSSSRALLAVAFCCTVRHTLATYGPGERCKGAPGYPAVSWQDPPCQGGASCNVPDPEYGFRCPAASGTSSIDGDCYGAGERGQGAEGHLNVPFKPCCDGSEQVPKDNDWGLFCPPVGSVGTISEKHCYGPGERGQGAEGQPNVVYKPCCDGSAQVSKEGDWGMFCPSVGSVDTTTTTTTAPTTDQSGRKMCTVTLRAKHTFGCGLDEYCQEQDASAAMALNVSNYIGCSRDTILRNTLIVPLSNKGFRIGNGYWKYVLYEGQANISYVMPEVQPAACRYNSLILRAHRVGVKQTILGNGVGASVHTGPGILVTKSKQCRQYCGSSTNYVDWSYHITVSCSHTVQSISRYCLKINADLEFETFEQECGLDYPPL